MKASISSESRVERVILLMRGLKVILDSDLATFYGVETKELNRAVRRNMDRFPPDFMFQLSADEYAILRRQFGTLRLAHGMHRKYLPLAFSEQGVAMLSSVLRSKHAIIVNIEIMRAFVRLRQFLASHHELARKLQALERKHEVKFEIVFEAIRQLSTPPVVRRRPIGFRTSGDS